MVDPLPSHQFRGGALAQPPGFYAAVEFRTVVGGELLQHCHDVLGLAPPVHSNGQAEVAVLVDHVQKLKPAAIGGGIELEVHRPNLVGVLGAVAPQRAVRGPGPLPLEGSGALQPILPPEPLHPLVVYYSAPLPQQAIGHSATPANLIRSHLPRPMSELGLLDRDDLASMALGTAVLTHHTRQAMRAEGR